MTEPESIDELEIEPDMRSFRRIKILLISIGILSLLIVIAFSSITRIDASHVGIIVNLTGNSRGVAKTPVRTGWVFFNPITRQVIEFPLSIQNIVWTKSSTEGSTHNDSVTFSSIGGVVINCDISIAFHIDPSMSPKLFYRFYTSDLMSIANGYVRSTVREAFNSTASNMTISQIYGAKKSFLVERVARIVQKKLGAFGFVIDQITINGAFRLPEKVATAINLSIAAKETVIKEKYEIEIAKEKADQVVEKALGYSKAVKIRAKADEESYEIQKKLDPIFLQKLMLENWDGKLPVFMGSGANPLFNVSKYTK
ncbi:MAG TPA: hypothetical protein ENI76_08270 [Ignavibacteria bacterium]|nr:hypothetical protein [Ignavibacteria bacterium]